MVAGQWIIDTWVYPHKYITVSLSGHIYIFVCIGDIFAYTMGCSIRWNNGISNKFHQIYTCVSVYTVIYFWGCGSESWMDGFWGCV